VVLVVVVAVVALAVVVSTRHGPQLARLRLRAVRLLVAVACVQVGTAMLAPGSVAARWATLVLTALLVGLFLWGNRSVAGVPLIALGLLLNVVVIASNAAMPVSLTAAAAAGVPTSPLRTGTDPVREPLGDGTHLGLLADRIPVPAPGWAQVVSVGDLLVASGVGLLLLAGSVPAPARRPRQAVRRAERSMAFAMESTTRGSYS
jgi:hypothetical protein